MVHVIYSTYKSTFSLLDQAICHYDQFEGDYSIDWSQIYIYDKKKTEQCHE